MGQTIREICQWNKYTFFFPLFLAIVTIFLGMLPTVPSAVLSITYVLIVVMTVWSIGCWIYSDFRKTRNPSTSNVPRRKDFDQAKLGRFRVEFYLWDGVVIGGTILVGLCALYGVHYLKIQKELNSPYGVLYPGNEPMPETSCTIADDSVALFFGGGGVSLFKIFPHPIISVDGKDVFVIDRGEDGELLPSLDVMGPDGTLLVRIVRGQFQISDEDTFPNLPRTDRNKLSVLDRRGNEVLNINYLNPRAISIDAILHYPGFEPVILGKKRPNIRGNRFGGGCSYDSGTDIALVSQTTIPPRPPIPQPPVRP